MRIRLFIWCIILTGFSNQSFSQDPQFSQFYANQLYTNPAFAGSSGNYRIIANGRDQYTALQNNYKTVSASIDANFPKLGGGFGLLTTSDVAGDGQLTTNTLSGIYSYELNVHKDFVIRAGIQASIFQKSYDFSKFKFGDQIDDRYGFIYSTAEKVAVQQITYPNFSAGILGYTQLFYFGFAVHNLTQPNQSFYYPNSSDDQYKLPRRYTAHAGLNIYTTDERDEYERFQISPNVIYMQQRNYNQINLGFYLRRRFLTTGFWFRQTSQNSDAVIFLLGVKLPNPQLRIGYSYDVTVSGASTATQGSHELSLCFEITPPKHQRKIFRPLICPAL